VKVDKKAKALPALNNLDRPQFQWFSETKSYVPFIEDAVYVNDQTSAFIFIGMPGESVGLYRDTFNSGDEVGPQDGHHLIVTIPPGTSGAPGAVIVPSLEVPVHPPVAFPTVADPSQYPVAEIPPGDSEQDAISAVVFLS
jgi:hypothetical protein